MMLPISQERLRLTIDLQCALTGDLSEWIQWSGFKKGEKEIGDNDDNKHQRISAAVGRRERGQGPEVLSSIFKHEISQINIK